MESNGLMASAEGRPRSLMQYWGGLKSGGSCVPAAPFCGILEEVELMTWRATRDVELDEGKHEWTAIV